MTDDQIRAWLDKKPVFLSHESISDCLTELLQHRQLHRSIQWAVWVRDQSAESGWEMAGCFKTLELAKWYREKLWYYAATLEGPAKEADFLVLPFQERPCLTAR